MSKLTTSIVGFVFGAIYTGSDIAIHMEKDGQKIVMHKKRGSLKFQKEIVSEA